MADFIAVIRRAVDGLTDNTPELRAKVYDKARAAVQRQLENMKPAPPADMLRRQMEKLEAAIIEVEQENAEALPPLQEVAEQEPFESGEPDQAAMQAMADEPATASVDYVEQGPELSAELPAAEPTWQQADQPHAYEAVPEPVRADQPEPVAVPVVEPKPAITPARPPEPEDPLAAFLDSMPSNPTPVASRSEPPLWDAPAVEHVSAPVEVTQAEQAPIIQPQFAEAPIVEAANIEARVEDHGFETAPEPKSAEPAFSEPESRPDVAAETAEALTPAPEPERSWPVDIDGEPDVWVDPDAPQAAQAGEPEAVATTRAPEVEIAPEPAVTEPAPVVAEPVRVEPVASQTSAATASVDPLLDQLDEAKDDSVKMPRAAFDENGVLADFNELLSPPPPAADQKPAPEFSWDAPFDDLPEPTKPAMFEQALAARQADNARPQPAVPAPTQPAVAADPLLAAFEPVAETRNPAPAGNTQPASNDPLAELDNLIGFTRKQAAAPAKKTNGDDIPADVSRAMSKLDGKSFRTQPRERSRAVAIGAFALIIVALLGGAATAVWMNQDKISAFVASLSGTATPTPDQPKADKTADAATPDTKPADTSPAKVDKVIEASQPDPNAGTEVASLETGPEKFTQRLLTDGTETAGDATPVSIDPKLTEGRSEAKQTEPGKDPVVADAKVPAATDATATDQAQAPVVVAQKMFLYEERLGQGTPSALDGSVTWAVKEQTGDNGKPDPVIEATLKVPERNMTALITFKRNADPSLPASHIIEIVFQLPKDFEGGNVESVDRIAMKQTEQDRGNALIAVPAKITDDFHMIALNDDKEAVANNVELLKTRSWIDIPVTYRNGRRALITLEKGTTGAEAFDKVMKEWAALGTAQATP